MKNLSALVMKHRKPIIIFTVLLTLILGYFIKDLTINPDITSYLPKSDPVVELSDYIGKEYGGNLLAMVALETDDVFKNETLKKIDYLTSELQSLEGVSYVTSLTNVLDIKSSEDEFEVGKLIDPGILPLTPQEIQALKEYTLSKEMFRGRLVSADTKATLIVCRLQEGVDQVAVSKLIKETVSSINLEEKVYYGGLPFLMNEISSSIIKDIKTLTPLAALLIIVFLFFSFRSWAGVILPLLSVAISAIWTLGIMSLLKIPLTIISDTIPVILTAVGSAYSIHVFSKLRENSQLKGETRETFLQRALSEVTLPVILAALTTIVGFISFIFGSYLTMIQEFGIFSSLGVLFALITSVTLVPAVFSLWFKTTPKGAAKRKGNSSTPNSIPRPFAVLGRWVLKNRRIVLGVGAFIVIVSMIGIPKIERKVDLMDYFAPGAEIRQTEEQIMKKKFGGSIPLQILVTGDIQDPLVLQEMQKLQDFLEAKDIVANPQSVVELIKELNYAMGEGRAIPDSKAKVSNLWFLLEGEEAMEQLVNRDKTEALIQATIIFTGMDKITRLVDEINLYLRENPSEVCSFAQTGMHYVYKNLDASLLKSQFQSLLLSLTLIFLVVSLLLRSVSGGLIGLIPNVFTLIVVFGYMGFSKTPLDIATVLVGGASMGIGIDYSIHLLTRFKQGLRLNGDKAEVMVETLKTTGRAILINVITVTAGFLVFTLASLIPLQRFGALIALTMVSSGCGALVLLPAVILSTKKGFHERSLIK